MKIFCATCQRPSIFKSDSWSVKSRGGIAHLSFTYAIVGADDVDCQHMIVAGQAPAGWRPERTSGWPNRFDAILPFDRCWVVEILTVMAGLCPGHPDSWALCIPHPTLPEGGVGAGTSPGDDATSLLWIIEQLTNGGRGVSDTR